jgi:hypothetical protein
VLRQHTYAQRVKEVLRALALMPPAQRLTAGTAS